ncbi:uncharacterized protein FTJAE_8765 [Fusarium tjaetaba]|uniref:Uncharacterized protein n=1 Tax=Fusarium tjaetaba TaxID=1567544 RepID=A0A8H5R457_9HYPO|nr:uncharacterized protein FTJAE_8765 [Fusarium tjaetaba]KAF5628675.1 hypothetical protein FTJAE_8765 [Fusarium tjaetaba]
MSAEIDPSNQSLWYEGLQSDVFWVFTILIILHSIWSERQLVLLTWKDKGQEDTQSSATPPKPPLGINFKDQITSRLRQYLVLLFCALPIPGQLAHGLDVLKIIWRLSVSLVQWYYPVDTRPFLLGIIMFSPIAIPLLVAWLVVVGTGCAIVLIQIRLFVEVWKLKPNARPDLSLACKEEV